MGQNQAKGQSVRKSVKSREERLNLVRFKVIVHHDDASEWMDTLDAIILDLNHGENPPQSYLKEKMEERSWLHAARALDDDEFYETVNYRFGQGIVAAPQCIPFT